AEKKMIADTETTPIVNLSTRSGESATCVAGRNISTRPTADAFPASTGSESWVTHVNGTKIHPIQSKIGVSFAANKPISPTERMDGRIADDMSRPSRKLSQRLTTRLGVFSRASCASFHATRSRWFVTF